MTLGRREFAMTGLSAAAFAALNATGLAQSEKPKGRSRSDHYGKCAEACHTCQRECLSCAVHCADSISEGSKHHLATLQSCQDCADICAAAASVVAREGVYAKIICEACADACAQCAKACEQHGREDKVMQQCAEECRKCEKACREMLSATGNERRTK